MVYILYLPPIPSFIRPPPPPRALSHRHPYIPHIYLTVMTICLYSRCSTNSSSSRLVIPGRPRHAITAASISKNSACKTARTASIPGTSEPRWRSTRAPQNGSVATATLMAGKRLSRTMMPATPASSPPGPARIDAQPPTRDTFVCFVCWHVPPPLECYSTTHQRHNDDSPETQRRLTRDANECLPNDARAPSDNTHP